MCWSVRRWCYIHSNLGFQPVQGCHTSGPTRLYSQTGSGRYSFPEHFGLLAQVDTLRITSDYTVFGNWTTAIKALPGFSTNLRRADNIFIYNSGLQNMTSFSGLRCLRNLEAQYNPALTSLGGLQSATAPPSGPGTDAGNGLFLYDNPLPTGSSFAALRAFAGCPSSSTSPWSSAITVYNLAMTCKAEVSFHFQITL
jgi:hypothetical protein